MYSENRPEQEAAGGELPAVLGNSPALLDKYHAFLDSFKNDGLVSQRILDLCHVRIAWIHGVATESLGLDLDKVVAQQLKSDDYTGFSEVELAALALAEKISLAHHQIDDAEVAAVSAHLGPAGCVSLITALAFYDVNCRLNRVFPGVEK